MSKKRRRPRTKFPLSDGFWGRLKAFHRYLVALRGDYPSWAALENDKQWDFFSRERGDNATLLVRTMNLLGQLAREQQKYLATDKAEVSQRAWFCRQCGRLLKRRALYCSGKCRQAAYRERKRDETT
jgi:hypothetical protein